MRKSIFIILLPLFLLGCGGGGGKSPVTPTTTGLASLAGTWHLQTIITGNLYGTGGVLPINESISVLWYITSNSITSEDGGSLVWSYDNTTLTVQNAVSTVDYDYNCGNVYLTGNMTLTIPLPNNATNGIVSGIINMSILSDYCDGYSGQCQITGNFTKQ